MTSLRVSGPVGTWPKDQHGEAGCAKARPWQHDHEDCVAPTEQEMNPGIHNPARRLMRPCEQNGIS